MAQDKFFSAVNALPALERGKPVAARVDDLQNYIYQMWESLNYLLRNLNPTENFNGAQIGSWTDTLLSPLYDQTAELRRDVGELRRQTAETSAKVAALEDALTGMGARLGALEGLFGALDAGFEARVDAVLAAHGLI